MHVAISCRVFTAYSWLNSSACPISGVIEQEQNDSSSFQPMPFYFMEIACLLFEGCRDIFGTEYIQVRSMAVI